jgi:hypothetical protein
MSIDKDFFTGENLNIVGEVPEHSGIGIYENDNEYSQILIGKIESRTKDSMKQITTDIPQEDSIVPIDTILKNNKKSYITKINTHIHSPRYVVPNSFYIELMEYNGRVLEIDKTASKFTAELINTADENEKLEAEFDVSDIDKGDMGLLRDGALFVWKIGKEENNGTQQKISQLVFRRLTSWRTVDIKRTEEVAKSKAAAIRAIAIEDSTAAQ